MEHLMLKLEKNIKNRKELLGSEAFRSLLATSYNIKISMDQKRPRIAKAFLRKNNKSGGLTFSNFSLYYQHTVIKRVWYWHKDKYKCQWN